MRQVDGKPDGPRGFESEDLAPSFSEPLLKRHVQELKQSKTTHKSCHALTIFIYRNVHVGLARIKGTETFATSEGLEYIGDVGSDRLRGTFQH